MDVWQSIKDALFGASTTHSFSSDMPSLTSDPRHGRETSTNPHTPNLPSDEAAAGRGASSTKPKRSPLDGSVSSLSLTSSISSGGPHIARRDISLRSTLPFHSSQGHLPHQAAGRGLPDGVSIAAPPAQVDVSGGVPRAPQRPVTRNLVAEDSCVVPPPPASTTSAGEQEGSSSLFLTGRPNQEVLCAIGKEKQGSGATACGEEVSRSTKSRATEGRGDPLKSSVSFLDERASTEEEDEEGSTLCSEEWEGEWDDDGMKAEEQDERTSMRVVSVVRGAIKEERMREAEQPFYDVLLPRAVLHASGHFTRPGSSSPYGAPSPVDAASVATEGDAMDEEGDERRIDMNALRELSWHGCPAVARGTAWRMLTGYTSSTKASSRAFLPVSFCQRYSEKEALLQNSRQPDEKPRPRRHRLRQEALQQDMKEEPPRATPAPSPSPTPPSQLLTSCALRRCDAQPPPASVIRKRREYLQTVQQLYGGAIQHAGESLAVGSTTMRSTLSSPSSSAFMSSRYAAYQGSNEAKVLVQLRKDLPRMQFGHIPAPHAGETAARDGREGSSANTHTPSPFIQHPRVQATMERVLYCWSVRHPASGYVQGMNDLIAPFVSVIIAEYVCPDTHSVTNLLHLSASHLDEVLSEAAIPEAIWRSEIEPDVYGLSCFLLDLVQGHYTQQQAGFLGMVHEMDRLVAAADPALYTHLKKHGIETVQYSFRWMNCLLMRELQPWQVLRLLDAFLSSASVTGRSLLTSFLLEEESSLGGEGLKGGEDEEELSTQEDCLHFHVFVCVALLLRFAPVLMRLSDFSEMLTLLQQLPTEMLNSRDVDELLAEAFLLKSVFYTRRYAVV